MSGRDVVRGAAGCVRWMEQLEPRVLLAADPISTDHELWAVPRGSAVIDGVLDDAAWASALVIERSQPTRSDRALTVRMMYDDGGMYLSARAQDANLWADGLGNGAGNRWEVESDDSVTFYFDPNGSRDEYFQASDRAIGVNIAPAGADSSSLLSSVVSRRKFVQGTGAGGAPDVNPGGTMPTGFVYQTRVEGTLNTPGDVDVGWTVEMFVPWSALGMSAPAHGDVMGMNFDVIFDNDGGDRNFTDNRNGPQRFALPLFVDDHLQGAFSSYTSSQSGIRGPVNYAEVMFVDARANARPQSVIDLRAGRTTAYAARLEFTAPAATEVGAKGHVSRYAIRWASAPITNESQWAAATEYEQAFTPRLRGSAESLQLVGLPADQSLHFAVRGVDGAGNLGAIGNSALVRTTPVIPGQDGNRIMVSPFGHGLVRDDGRPFVAVGDHLGINWAYTRNLYPGDVWDPVQRRFLNFNDEPSFEGVARPYFQELKARGINTMRIFMELHNLDQTGNPENPRGRYWIEYPAGTFNPAMQPFIQNLLAEAEAADMYVILSPFDTFSYDEAFTAEVPFARVNGGPLDSINDFFQTPAVKTMVQTRLANLVASVKSSAFAHRVLGWEPMNEWDSYEWTLNAEGNAEPGRETEMRRRAVWMNEVSAFLRSVDDERLVIDSTIARDPRGPIGRAVFNSRAFDVLAPHFYTNPSEEPINNPDSDKSFDAAVENANLTAYWMTSRTRGQPLINGEWGMTRVDWPNNLPAYSASFTRQDDEALFRAVIWSGFAQGQIGTGLRISTEELAFNSFLLTEQMRGMQQTLARFAGDTTLRVNFGRFDARPADVRVLGGAPVEAWGSTDGGQGVVYALLDGNRSTFPVSGAELQIAGLNKDALVDIEIWSTEAGTTAALSRVTGVWTGSGTVRVTLPTFARDVAVKFASRTMTTSAQTVQSIGVDGLLVTASLGNDGQPVITKVNTATDAVLVDNLASLTNFRGRGVDLHVFRTPAGAAYGPVIVAMTDTQRQLWVFWGDPSAGTWQSVNLTALLDAPGMTGDLTSYMPSWGTIHIAGLDARGHAINYWWAPEHPKGWAYTDLTLSYNGPTLRAGLTGYVAAWDGLNLAGLNDAGETVVYWWAPDRGAGNWASQNMTRDFNGPVFAGQLDAYVTSWGGLNILGVTASGEMFTYWWVPTFDVEPNRWRITSITDAAEARANPVFAPLTPGVEGITTSDGGINLFGVDTGGRLNFFRWRPPQFEGDPAPWRLALGSTATSRSMAFPLAASATGETLGVFSRRANDPTSLVAVSFAFTDPIWQVDSVIALPPVEG